MEMLEILVPPALTSWDLRCSSSIQAFIRARVAWAGSTSCEGWGVGFPDRHSGQLLLPAVLRTQGSLPPAPFGLALEPGDPGSHGLWSAN